MSTIVTIEKPIAGSSDDAEELLPGLVHLTSSDLEFGYKYGQAREVGLRFTDLDIPQAAVITSAYIQFRTDEANVDPASLQIRGEDVDDASAFAATFEGISARPTTSASVTWAPPAWGTTGEVGPDQRSPDLGSIVQEIVSRPGWVPGNDIAFTITGSGTRVADSYDGGAAGAPVLHIEYVVPDTSADNAAPTDIMLVPDTAFAENVAGAVAGALVVSDPDSGDVHNFTVSDSRFEVSNGQLKLKDDVRLDYERGAQVPLTVTAIDSGGLSVSRDLTLSVGDVAETRFAAFGDYGAKPGEAAVAQLVDDLNVDFIVTVGDNVYGSTPIDDQIGRYYSDYIGNYRGDYGSGSATNRFFPALGNHDYSDAAGSNARSYLNYFTLPDNERYYDFTIGPVHFFALNSNSQEPDGRSSSSEQAQWLKTGLANSSSPYNIVFFHHPPYTSGEHGSTTVMQWPFEQWGATAVLSGHDHDYERVLRDDNGDGTVLPYFITGLGGADPRGFETTVEGSAARYNADWGTLLVQASDSTLTFDFVSVDGEFVDSYTIDVPDAAALTGNAATMLEAGNDIMLTMPEPISYGIADSAVLVMDGADSGSATGLLDEIDLLTAAASGDDPQAIMPLA